MRRRVISNIELLDIGSTEGNVFSSENSLHRSSERTVSAGDEDLHCTIIICAIALSIVAYFWFDCWMVNPRCFFRRTTRSSENGIENHSNVLLDSSFDKLRTRSKSNSILSFELVENSLSGTNKKNPISKT